MRKYICFQAFRMSKKKSKTQKKKFFAHPKNKNRVFKKKEAEPNEIAVKASEVLRRRGLFTVLPPGGLTVPTCTHGPCLLFGKKEGEVISDRFFACAVYRNDFKTCSYKWFLNDDGTVARTEGYHGHSLPPAKVEEWKYNCNPKNLKAIAKDSMLLFCRKCNEVFEKKHRCPAEEVQRKDLKYPSKFLTTLDSQSGEAQYFFSEESLSVMLSVIKSSKVDGILLIGSPRIAEMLKAEKTSKQSFFMLDYDKRYANFYPSTQFAQYSMLVDHFFDPNSEAKLVNFFAKCEKILLICDPPFGVFMEPLVETIHKMQKRHALARKDIGPHSFYSCVVIPLFVGKHILRLDNSYWMCDYRVTYDNHKDFSKEAKSIVKIFTNLPASSFDLSHLENYIYCELCEKFVSKRNKHCYMCSACTSKDGSSYKHCERCMRCVKTSYRHCSDCSRCHLQGRCATKVEE